MKTHVGYWVELNDIEFVWKEDEISHLRMSVCLPLIEFLENEKTILQELGEKGQKTLYYMKGCINHGKLLSDKETFTGDIYGNDFYFWFYHKGTTEESRYDKTGSYIEDIFFNTLIQDGRIESEIEDKIEFEYGLYLAIISAKIEEKFKHINRLINEDLLPLMNFTKLD